MSKANASKGASKLASVIQNRMSKVAARASGVVAEKGEILSGKRLKLYSLPDDILDKDDYSVCATITQKLPCQKKEPINTGDQVLVIWTYDGEPVVVDRIVDASSEDAYKELKCECTECAACKNFSFKS